MGLTLIILGAVMIVAGMIIVFNSDKKQQVSTNLENSNTRTQIHSDAANITTNVENENRLSGSNTATTGVSASAEDAATTKSANNHNSETLSAKEKGDLFEDFTVNLLADWRLKLLDRTQDKMSSSGVVAESCKQPDLHVQQKRGKSNIDYYLECKYRSDWYNGSIIFEDWQIKRYRDFQSDSHRKVIIVLGVGGTPSKPATFMLVPLDSIKDNSIKKAWVSSYAIQPNTESLINYMDNYFSDVFASSRKKRTKSQ